MEMLEDLIMAAVNECSRKLTYLQDKLGGALGGLRFRPHLIAIKGHSSHQMDCRAIHG